MSTRRAARYIASAISASITAGSVTFVISYPRRLWACRGRIVAPRWVTMMTDLGRCPAGTNASRVK